MRFLTACFTLLCCILAPTSAHALALFKPVPRPTAVDTLRALIDLGTGTTGLDTETRDRVKSMLETIESSAHGRGDIPDSLAEFASKLNAIAKLQVAEKANQKWCWRPVVNLPALKITGSTRANAKVDGQVLTAVGGGISYQHLEWDDKKGEHGAWKSLFSFSPATILVSGNFSKDDNQLNISPAATIGFWDNLIMLGGGYDLGEVTGRHRTFGLLSIGITFNNSR